MELKEHRDQYYVAAKAFIVNEDKFLITKDIFNDGYDLPGGRLKEDDFELSFEDLLKRKITEELGAEIKYEIGEPVVFMRHEREEHYSNGDTGRRRIFAVGYLVKYLGGEINLGKHHEKHEWVSVKDFDPAPYFTGGWLKGIKDFQSVYKSKK